MFFFISFYFSQKIDWKIHLALKVCVSNFFHQDQFIVFAKNLFVCQAFENLQAFFFRIDIGNYTFFCLNFGLRVDRLLHKKWLREKKIRRSNKLSFSYKLKSTHAFQLSWKFSWLSLSKKLILTYAMHKLILTYGRSLILLDFILKSIGAKWSCPIDI